jgi:hypothetical protein
MGIVHQWAGLDQPYFIQYSNRVDKHNERARIRCAHGIRDAPWKVDTFANWICLRTTERVGEKAQKNVVVGFYDVTHCTYKFGLRWRHLNGNPLINSLSQNTDRPPLESTAPSSMTGSGHAPNISGLNCSRVSYSHPRLPIRFLPTFLSKSQYYIE